MNVLVNRRWGVIFILFMSSLGGMLPAQNVISTTGYMTDDNHVTMAVTQQVSTRLRRTTSQGDPEACLPYMPGEAPNELAIPLAQTVMARYPDYRMAYWKDYTNG